MFHIASKMYTFTLTTGKRSTEFIYEPFIFVIVKGLIQRRARLAPKWLTSLVHDSLCTLPRPPGIPRFPLELAVYALLGVVVPRPCRLVFSDRISMFSQGWIGFSQGSLRWIFFGISLRMINLGSHVADILIPDIFWSGDETGKTLPARLRGIPTT